MVHICDGRITKTRKGVMLAYQRDIFRGNILPFYAFSASTKERLGDIYIHQKHTQCLA